MCHLRNIAMCDYLESVTTGQTDTQTDRQTQDKVIPMCRYASQATQKVITTFQVEFLSGVQDKSILTHIIDYIQYI